MKQTNDLTGLVKKIFNKSVSEEKRDNHLNQINDLLNSNKEDSFLFYSLGKVYFWTIGKLKTGAKGIFEAYPGDDKYDELSLKNIENIDFSLINLPDITISRDLFNLYGKKIKLVVGAPLVENEFIKTYYYGLGDMYKFVEAHNLVGLEISKKLYMDLFNLIFYNEGDSKMDKSLAEALYRTNHNYSFLGKNMTKDFLENCIDPNIHTVYKFK